MSEKVWLLKRCRLFEQLEPSDLASLERHAALGNFRKRDIIYAPMEPGQSVLVLSRGRVKIKDITQDGKETILAFVEEGEIFGELALLDDGARNEFAEAMEDSTILLIPRQEVLALMQRRPSLSLHITKLVGLRRKRIENRLRNILFHSNRERVLRLLHELLEVHGRQEEDQWEIGLRLSHQDLASLIGATRETVTLILGELQAEGLIRVSRRRISVLDRQRLHSELQRPRRTASENGPLALPTKRSKQPMRDG